MRLCASREHRQIMNNMVYQTLVIKDARRVNQCWKWTIVLIQLCIVMTGLTVTFSFHALLDNFNSNCISGVNLVFVHRDEMANSTGETPTIDIGPRSTVEGSSSSITTTSTIGYHNYTEQLRSHFEPVGDAKGVGKLRRNFMRDPIADETARRQLVRNEEDMVFFDTQTIDEANTFWGSKTPCDYFTFVPLLEAIVAIVWLTLFIMCGNGGKSNETFVDEPWRIVPPAFVFFVLMTVISSIHLCLLIARLDVFCSELKQHFNDQTVPCSLLINQFSLNHQTAVQPSQNYSLTVAFTWLTLVCWTASVAVMAARCYLGIDFELNGPTPLSTTSSASDSTPLKSTTLLYQRPGDRPDGVDATLHEEDEYEDDDDDDCEELEEDTVEVVMQLNGKELKLSADPSNRYIDALDEQQELTTNPAFANRVRRLVNEVKRPSNSTASKAIRFKAYGDSIA